MDIIFFTDFTAAFRWELMMCYAFGFFETLDLFIY